MRHDDIMNHLDYILFIKYIKKKWLFFYFYFFILVVVRVYYIIIYLINSPIINYTGTHPVPGTHTYVTRTTF